MMPRSLSTGLLPYRPQISTSMSGHVHPGSALRSMPTWRRLTQGRTGKTIKYPVRPVEPTSANGTSRTLRNVRYSFAVGCIADIEQASSPVARDRTFGLKSFPTRWLYVTPGAGNMTPALFHFTAAADFVRSAWRPLRRPTHPLDQAHVQSLRLQANAFAESRALQLDNDPTADSPQRARTSSGG